MSDKLSALYKLKSMSISLKHFIELANCYFSNPQDHQLPFEELQSLANSPDILFFLHEQINNFINNPNNELPLVDSSRLVLYLSEHYTLFLSLQNSNSKYLYSQPFIGAFTPLTPHSVLISEYKYPSCWNSEQFDRTVKLKYISCTELRTGEVFSFNGNAQLIDIKIPQGNAVLLKMFCHPISTLEWVFDKNSLDPIGVISVDPLASRRQYMTKVLGAIGDKSSIPSLETMLDDRAHFVRWSALQAIGFIDREAGIRALNYLSNDEHYDIRIAVRKILDTL